MNKFAKIILEELESRSNGGAPVTVNYLADVAGINEKNSSCPLTRDIIRLMIDDGVCIGSNSQGYFLITNGKQCQQYLNSLMKRQIGISKRIQAVYDSAIKGGLL